jgi:hypothetical protein
LGQALLLPFAARGKESAQGLQSVRYKLCMPLQNRMTPIGEPIAISARGTLMGNRGGRLHTGDKELTSRRWVSRQWICCVLDFRGRHRDVWGDSYTEFFFLDEVTALAAGHRPCFECRRRDALAFAALFPRTHRASAMDKILHAERLDGKAKRLNEREIDELPDGTMVVFEDGPAALRGKRLLKWTPRGYGGTLPRPRNIAVGVLTPPSILTVLAKGYAPHWHSSAALSRPPPVTPSSGAE